MSQPGRARSASPRQREHDDEQQQAFQQRLVDLAGMARQARTPGKIIAQGSQSGAGRPHSSPLMKLAMRPKPSPIGAHTAMRSAKASSRMPLRRQNQHDRDADAERAAMEAHAAVPDREDLRRVRR